MARLVAVHSPSQQLMAEIHVKVYILKKCSKILTKNTVKYYISLTFVGKTSGNRDHPLGRFKPSSGMSRDTSSPSNVTSVYGPASAPCSSK